jgi:hypothetical protein
MKTVKDRSKRRAEMAEDDQGGLFSPPPGVFGHFCPAASLEIWLIFVKYSG